MAAKIHFSSTLTREYSTPIRGGLGIVSPARACAPGRSTPEDLGSAAAPPSFSPVFLFHRRQDHGRRIEAGHLEIDSALWTDQNLADLHTGSQRDNSGALRA